MIHSLSHLRLISPDPLAWRRYGEEVLGLTTSSRSTDDVVRLRMDEHPARLTIVRGDRPAVDAIGFEVVDERALERVVTLLEEAGRPIERPDGDRLVDLGLTGAVTTVDPLGTRIEIGHGPARDHEPLTRRHVGGFLTGELGMGHVVLAGEALEDGLGFYRDTLGFVDRNTMRVGTSRGKPSEERLWFLGCNRRHHTVALMRRPGDAALIHLMIEVETVDDVGRVLDRSLAAGMPQRLTLGRHTNDRMLSFYSETPDGFVIEVGCDGLLVEPDTPTYEITATSHWGHHRVPREEPT